VKEGKKKKTEKKNKERRRNRKQRAYPFHSFSVVAALIFAHMMPRPSNLPPQSFSHFHSKAKINNVGLQKGSSAPASSRDLALKPGLKAWCVFCPLLFAGTAGGAGALLWCGGATTSK